MGFALPLVYALMRKERQPRSTDGVALNGAPKDWTRKEVLRDPIFWLILLGILAPGFIGTSIFFHQVYLVELRGWSMQAFAGSFVFMSVMNFSFIEAQWGIFAFMALLGMSYGVSGTLFGALWPEIYGIRHLGSIRAIIVAFMVFSTAMGPGITGFLIDYGVDYPSQILVMGAYCLVASIAMMLVSRMVKRRNITIAAADVA